LGGVTGHNETGVLRYEIFIGNNTHGMFMHRTGGQ
jgi:hypothetical protein